MIDLDALLQACQGDQTKKVSVNKQWLKTVHSELRELERIRDELAKARVVDDKLEKGFGKFNKGMDTIFGKGGAFDSIFGKGRYR